MIYVNPNSPYYYGYGFPQTTGRAPSSMQRAGSTSRRRVCNSPQGSQITTPITAPTYTQYRQALQTQFLQSPQMMNFTGTPSQGEDNDQDSNNVPLPSSQLPQPTTDAQNGEQPVLANGVTNPNPGEDGGLHGVAVTAAKVPEQVAEIIEGKTNDPFKMAKEESGSDRSIADSLRSEEEVNSEDDKKKSSERRVAEAINEPPSDSGVN